MLASNNILKPSDGRPVATPTQDMIIGLYHMTTVVELGKDEKPKAFGSLAEAELAYDAKVIGLQSPIRLRFRGEIRETTLGIALFNNALPEDFRYVSEQVGKKQIGQIVTELVDSHSRTEVAQTLDRIKDAGFHWATRSGVSMSIADANFDTSGKFDKLRGEMVLAAEKLHTAAQLKYEQGLTSDLERRDALGGLWLKTTNEIEAELKNAIPAGNAIKTMVESGARGNWLQIRSIIGMRGPVATSSGDFAPMPVKGNYLLGLTANEYFINATGARKGNADTAMKTAAAGYLTRRLVDVAQDVIVRTADCGTENGLDKDLLNQDEVELSIVARTLAENVVAGGKTLAKAGVVVTPTMVEEFKAAGLETVKVRTVLTCRSEQGICAACYGSSMATNEPVEIGEAIGIIAAQSIGEPGTQLTMRTFHTGGAASSAKKQTILKSIGGKKVRVERLISYDITQGLSGVTDLLEARIGWRNEGKIASIAFWDGTLRVETANSKLSKAKGKVTAVPSKTSQELLVAHVEDEKRADLVETGFFKAQVAARLYTKVVAVTEKDIELVYMHHGSEKHETIKLGEARVKLVDRNVSVKVGQSVKAGALLAPEVAGYKSLVAPVDGEITNVGATKITIKSIKLKDTPVSIVNNVMVDGELTEVAANADVKKGDRVKVGQVIASGSKKDQNVLSQFDGEVTKVSANEIVIKAEVSELVDVPLKAEVTLKQTALVKAGDTNIPEGKILAEGTLDYWTIEDEDTKVKYDVVVKVGQSIADAQTRLAVPSASTALEVYVDPDTDFDSQIKANAQATRWSFNRSVSKTFKKVAVGHPVATLSAKNKDDILVQDGARVKMGDVLTAGTPVPQEVLFLNGRRDAEAAIISGVQAIYGSQGVPLHDKHLEVIVRQMLGYVTITEQGDTDFSPGQVVLAETHRRVSREMVDAGKRPASAREELLGMTRASLAAESWLSAASFQETTRVLTQAALEGKTDRLYGLKENVIIGKLIPAGTGLREYRGVKVEATEEAKNEKYPNRIWSGAAAEAEVNINLESADLSFASIEDYSSSEAAE
jgi:DNA-directed RNA polymerase beta' subunit